MTRQFSMNPDPASWVELRGGTLAFDQYPDGSSKADASTPRGASSKDQKRPRRLRESEASHG